MASAGYGLGVHTPAGCCQSAMYSRSSSALHFPDQTFKVPKSYRVGGVGDGYYSSVPPGNSPITQLSSKGQLRESYHSLWLPEWCKVTRSRSFALCCQWRKLHQKGISDLNSLFNQDIQNQHGPPPPFRTLMHRFMNMSHFANFCLVYFHYLNG